MDTHTARVCCADTNAGRGAQSYDIVPLSDLEQKEAMRVRPFRDNRGAA